MPIRQTEAHRAREADVAYSISIEWKCIVDRMTPTSMIDSLCSREDDGGARQYLGAVEIKCRDYKANAFPTFFIGEMKVKALRVARKLLGVHSFIVVRWSNVTGWFNVDDFVDVRIGGRTDRGDANDIEPMCHYDVRAAKHMAVLPNIFK